jgi:3-hydroxybutyryl-CoA dehydrogenase
VLGPVENADLVGLDLTLAIHEYVLPRLEPGSEPSAGLRKRVASGQLGAASGQGFLRWSAEQAQAVRRRLVAHLSAGLT